jgi:hypothetical protein
VKTNTALQAQVESSAIYRTVLLDVAGANSNWALDISGAQFGLGLAIWLCDKSTAQI